MENQNLNQKIRIISAEDVEINQMLLERIFSHNKYELTTVYNGSELIEKLENESYDIIPMDIQMPIMNGIEATRIIRKSSKYSDIPIIAVSSYAFEEDVKEIMDSGINTYISKPLRKKHLMETIEKLLIWNYIIIALSVIST